MRLLGFRREFAVEYSNLLSIPVILGAVTYLIIENNSLIQLGTFKFNCFNSFNTKLYILINLFILIYKVGSKFLICNFAIYRILFGLAILVISICRCQSQIQLKLGS